MICAVIKGPTIEAAYQQIEKALPYADVVELRLDCFGSLDENGLRKLKMAFSIPMIFTLRSKGQGGSYEGTENTRLEKIRALATLKPEFLDLESCIPVEFFEEMRTLHPDVKVICSYHDFISTPQDLPALYRSLKQKSASLYKIAVMAENSLDALRLLAWVKNEGEEIIAVSMGPYGQISRILAPIVGSQMTYAAINKGQETAPGQLLAKTLVELYRYHSLNPKTKIYGLIGDPVEGSVGHETHNTLMKACDLDALYLKIPVKPTELASFLSFAKQLNFSGLSVTMPLKEEVMQYLDEVDSEAKTIGAVNTLLFEDGKLSGCNTDGIGALEAVEMILPVRNKRIVILGAGGAAKAIAYEACKRGGNVIIVNRNEEKARILAESLNCTAADLNAMKELFATGYDILVNTTPSQLPIDPNFILPSAVVMDIKTRPKEPLLLQHAKQKGCKVIYGYQMFIEQGIRQFDKWFNATLSMQKSREIIEEKVLTLLE